MNSNEQNNTYQSPQASSFNDANPEARISMVAAVVAVVTVVAAWGLWVVNSGICNKSYGSGSGCYYA